MTKQDNKNRSFKFTLADKILVPTVIILFIVTICVVISMFMMDQP